MTAIPDTIKALRSTPVKDSRPKIEVESIPFGSRKEISSLGADFVLIKTRAVALNPTDTASLGRKDGQPVVTVGCDVAGEVIAVGSAVEHLKIGDNASAFVFGTSAEFDGAFGEVVKVNRKNAWKMPDSMSFPEAAAVTLAHLTAVQALFCRFKLDGRPSSPTKTPETILICGGSTSVGHAAVQIAFLSGHRVIVTASPGAHEYLRSLGASETFDYNDEDLVNKIKAATKDGKGVKYAYDTASKGPTTEVAIDSIVPEGGQVITTLPVSDEHKNRRADVSAEFQLVYEVLDYEFDFMGHHFAHRPDDANLSLEWVTKEIPGLFRGWQTNNGGSHTYKGQKLRAMEGGLAAIPEGLLILAKGQHKAEKLVYPIE